jgi:hypothetical protein
MNCWSRGRVATWIRENEKQQGRENDLTQSEVSSWIEQFVESGRCNKRNLKVKSKDLRRCKQMEALQRTINEKMVPEKGMLKKRTVCRESARRLHFDLTLRTCKPAASCDSGNKPFSIFSSFCPYFLSILHAIWEKSSFIYTM